MASFASLLCVLATLNNSAGFEASASKHLKTLANPRYEGRLPITKGSAMAIDYIESQFKSAGLIPLPGETFRNPFSITIGERPTSRCFANFELANHATISLTPSVDFGPVSGAPQLRWTTGNITFFGYRKPSGSLAGQIVMFYREEKGDAGSVGERAQAAQAAGAKGIILVGPSGPGRRELPLLNRGQGIPPELGLPAIAISSTAFSKVFGMKFGTDVAQGTACAAKVKWVTETEPNRGESYNVVGMIPGNDPKLKSEYIIVGGHFDHLGYGEVSSRSGTDMIHNGADDNASGTSGVIALAQYFAKHRTNRRTLIFQCYSGEEEGLVGSAAWVRTHPDIILQTEAMFNMDMIGRLRDEKMTISAVVTCKEWTSILNGIQTEGVTPILATGLPGNSDHASFAAAKVPCLFFDTGLHNEYHTEKDTLATINFKGVGQILDYVSQVIVKTDALDHRLEYDPSATVAGGGDPSTTRRVRVGFIPDMSGGDGKPGFILGGASPGSPAEKAGVQAGDRLLTFDGKPVNSIEDLQAVLLAAKPNVTIKIVILRKGVEMTLELTPVPAP